MELGFRIVIAALEMHGINFTSSTIFKCAALCISVFKSIGCWADSQQDRAMESLEGKFSKLKQHDYKTRVNALMKCAEAADENDLELFAIQNGGQCFGGRNDKNTYRKHGASSDCGGDYNRSPSSIWRYLTRNS